MQAVAVQIGDRIVPTNANHAYFGQTGVVVKIESGGNTTQAKLDFDGDGVKDSQVIVEYTWSYQNLGQSIPQGQNWLEARWFPVGTPVNSTNYATTDRVVESPSGYALIYHTDGFVSLNGEDDDYYGLKWYADWSHLDGGGDDGHGDGTDDGGGSDGGTDDGGGSDGGTDDGGSDDNSGGSDNSGPVDTDDDVPTLLEIKDALSLLDQDNDSENLIIVQELLGQLLLKDVDSDDDAEKLQLIITELEKGVKAETLNQQIISIKETIEAIEFPEIPDFNATAIDYTPKFDAVLDKLGTLDKDSDSSNLNAIYERQADQMGLIQELENEELAIVITDYGTRLSQVADLEMSLRRLERDFDDLRGATLDENGTVISRPTLKDAITTIETGILDARGDIELENNETRKATLADIYYAIMGEQENNQTLGSSDNSEIENAIAKMKEKAGKFVDQVKTLADVNTQKMDTLFEMTAGRYNFYVDPLNNVVSGGIVDIGFSFADIANWVSLVIGFYAVFVYFQAQNKNVSDILEVIMIAPMSAPATTIPQIAVKIFLIGVLVASTLYGGLVAIWDANMTVMGVYGDFSQVFDGLKVFLTQSAWGSMAVDIFFDLVPVDTITTLFAMYWGGKLFFQLILVSGFSILKSSS